MAFQFTCPHGHLLEADPSFAGQQCTCPHCGILFIIPPSPAPAPHMAAMQPGPMTPPSPPMPYAQMPQPGPMAHAPAMPQPGPAEPALPQVGPNFTANPVAAAPDVTKPAEPEILHIPCPNGHELDTPREMLDQEVLCPHCGEQFLLREKDSVEYKQKKQAAAEAKERRRGKLWLNWAIAIAVLVLLGLVILILATSGS